MDKPGTLKNYVYQSVIAAICDGSMSPNSIFTEGQLVERFGVSKAPVREAMVQLCHEKVLRSIPRCGYQVVQISAKNMHDLIQLRVLLEVGSLSEVMKNLNASVIHELQQMNENRIENTGERDIWTAWHNNLEYHLKLNSIAGNEEVTAALQNTMNACTRAYAQGYGWQRVRRPSSSNEHPHNIIISALERGDLATAEEALTNDIRGLEIFLP